MINLGYEESKCVCCHKVYIHSLLIDLREDNKRFIICPDCAESVYEAIDSIRKIQK